MSSMAVLGFGTLAVLAIFAVAFVLIAVAVAPRSNPRDPRRHEPLSIEELEADAIE